MSAVLTVVYSPSLNESESAITMSTYVGVSIFYADDGKEWAKYLRAKLGSKQYAIHSELNEISDNPENHTRSANVNIFLISPDFLDLQDWDIMKDFNPTTTLAILTGIDFADLKRESQKRNCTKVLEWLTYELTGSEDERERNKSVREMMVTVVAAYEGALQDEKPGPFGSPATLRRTTSTPAHRKHANSRPSPSHYDFLPPLRQVNDLHTYVIQDDKIFVILHRQAEGSVQIHYKDDTTISADVSNHAHVYVFPISTKEQGKPFYIALDGRNIGESVQTSDDSVAKRSSEMLDNASETPETTNDTTAHLPQQTRETNTRSSSVNIGVQTEPDPSESNHPVNTKTSGRVHKQYSSKLDQIYDLLQDELDPEALLCRCLGIERDLALLDEKMTSMIESTEALRHISYPVEYDLREKTIPTSWPTLLHFGARYNLLNFCDALLINPLMHGACLTRNKDSDLPHDLARRHGHIELSEQLTYFSSFVSGAGREGRYDSGFSGGTPRLSTITLLRDSQPEGMAPRPHLSLAIPGDVSPGYIPMTNPLNKENLDSPQAYKDPKEFTDGDQTPVANPSKFDKPPRTISDDVGFADEEDDTENETPLDESQISSSYSGEDNSDIFGDLIGYSPDAMGTLQGRRGASISRESTSSGGSKSSFYLEEDNPSHSPHNRKDINSYLGTELQGSPSEKKGLFGFFKKKKTRSASEPSTTMPNKSKPKVYSRGSNRSSSTSTSSSSSTTLQDVKSQEDPPVQFRDADDHKSKTRFKLFMSKAQRRKSIRMKHALEDKNVAGPTLPPRRRIVAETF